MSSALNLDDAVLSVVHPELVSQGYDFLADVVQTVSDGTNAPQLDLGFILRNVLENYCGDVRKTYGRRMP